MRTYLGIWLVGMRETTKNLVRIACNPVEIQVYCIKTRPAFSVKSEIFFISFMVKQANEGEP